MKCFSFLGLAFLTLVSCNSRPQTAGIYYWKTSLEWSDSDTRRLTLAGVDRVGLRLFDWGKEGAEGPLLVRTPLPASMTVVPVVYVTVARLEAWAKDLDFDAVLDAKQLLGAMDRALSPAWSGRPVEYQLDADWAGSTRVAWFAVVGAFRDLVHARGGRLQVTVRLHQYRDRAAQGVPPADGAVVLLYGVGDAVIDLSTVEAYVRTPDYPLPVVLAFPDYTQVRQLNGYGRLVALHRLASGTELPAADLKLEAKNRYEVTRRSSLKGRPLLAHDELLVDTVEPEILAAVENLASIIDLRRRSGDRVWVFDYEADAWQTLVSGPLAPYLLPKTAPP